MKVSALVTMAAGQGLEYLNVNQEEILNNYFGESRRSLSEEDIEDKLPGLPDDISNYRDKTGCMMLVGSGTTNQKAKYMIGSKTGGMTFDSCADKCMKSDECRGIGYAAKAKTCEMFTERFYDLADANHVVMKVSDGSLWYDRVCLPGDTTYGDVVESLNDLSVAFHSYHLARRVNGYGDQNVCSDAKVLDSAAGFTFYQVTPNNNERMLTVNVISRCKACGLRPACYAYKAGHVYNMKECENIDKYFDAVGYPSGGKNGLKELQRILAKRVCGSDNVSNCAKSKKMHSCAAIGNKWVGGSACCSKAGWCDAGRDHMKSQGYTDLCAYVPGKMQGYVRTRN